MRVPQVSERVKEAPAQALRGVFAGIGQLLLITDKIRNKTPAAPPRTRKPEAPEPAAAVPVREPAHSPEPASSASEPSRGRDFDKTGNVRLISDGKSPTAVPEPETTAVPEPEAAGAAPPWANYGELSLASLRARLRSLDVAQVRELVGYERTHAGRGDVISMFERRIVKLEGEAKAQDEATLEGGV